MENSIDKKKKVIILGIICLIILLSIGVSYAYWKFVYMQSDKNLAVSKCLKLELSNEENNINLTNIYPISDEEGKKLTPYTFTLTNTCTISAKYSVNLEMLEGTTLNSKYLDVLVNNGDINLLSSYDETKTVVAGSVESRTLFSDILTPGASKDYSLSIWMDKDVTLDDDAENKIFQSKVVIDAIATTTIVDNIVSQLETTGKCPTVNEAGFVVKPDGESESGYLCSAPDVYGTSYYYRGTVDNNYVYFAGYYWRIVRINGDGSIRLIYDGTILHENGEASDDRQIGTSVFNVNIDDNASIGYMYGNYYDILEDSDYYSTFTWSNKDSYYISKEYIFNDITKKFELKNPIAILTGNLNNDYIGYYTTNSFNPSSNNNILYKITDITTDDSETRIAFKRVYYGTTSKEQAQTNENDSDVKLYLDGWYENNINGSEYDQYVVDNIYCNDRKVVSGLGYGKEYTSYRWISYSSKLLLTCPQQNDAFTVNDIKYGNGFLKYPIGLLSADEFWLAGGSGSSNSNFYLYTGNFEWLMSPVLYTRSSTQMRGQGDNGSLGYNDAISKHGIRPVLNLKSDALKYGDGTMNNPYHI